MNSDKHPPRVRGKEIIDFVVYVLRDIASTHALSETEPYTEAELIKVKERLRSLGYL